MDPEPNPLVRGTDPRNRNQAKRSRIPNTAFGEVRPALLSMLGCSRLRVQSQHSLASFGGTEDELALKKVQKIFTKLIIGFVARSHSLLVFLH